MPFWKQSEDPWDRKPEKRREPKESKDTQANPIDSLKAWNEGRRAKAKEKEEAKRLPPEPCPWCGKDMEQGYMTGGGRGIRWYAGVFTTKAALIGDLEQESFSLEDEESVFTAYKTVWLCRDCGKMVFDMPESMEYGDDFSDCGPEDSEYEWEEDESEE